MSINGKYLDTMFVQFMDNGQILKECLILVFGNQNLLKELYESHE